MVKKGSILALALLLSLPGCWKKDKKASEPKKTKKMAQLDVQKGDEFDDKTLQSFFDDMDEFTKYDADLDLADAGDEYDKHEFAWAEDDDKKLDTIYFAFDKADVAEDQKDKIESAIDKAKDMLAEAKADGLDAKLVVAGYACSSAGSKAYNQKISEKRAKVVADQLVAHGILADDIVAKGYGNSNLVVDSGSRDEQWQNRRVEIDIVHS